MAFVWLIQLVESHSLRTIIETPKFAGEAEILQSLLQIIEQPSENGDRLELLQTVILYQLCEPLKLQSLKSNLPKLLAEVQQRLKRPIPGDSLPVPIANMNWRFKWLWLYAFVHPLTRT